MAGRIGKVTGQSLDLVDVFSLLQGFNKIICYVPVWFIRRHVMGFLCKC